MMTRSMTAEYEPTPYRRIIKWGGGAYRRRESRNHYRVSRVLMTPGNTDVGLRATACWACCALHGIQHLLATFPDQTTAASSTRRSIRHVIRAACFEKFSIFVYGCGVMCSWTAPHSAIGLLGSSYRRASSAPDDDLIIAGTVICHPNSPRNFLSPGHAARQAVVPDTSHAGTKERPRKHCSFIRTNSPIDATTL